MSASQMKAEEYLREGHLGEAINALNQEVRRDPLDPRLRTFLFELLSFAGEYDRGEKQLDVLSSAGQSAAVGALLYRSAIHASRERETFFEGREYENQLAASSVFGGTVNDVPFESLSDSDPRIGPRLEVFVAGRYLWVPYQHISSLEVQSPRRLRDLIWATAIVRTSAAFKGMDLGEVLLPVLSPDSWRHSNDDVRLGRRTDWLENDQGVQVPVGLKMLQTDEQELPFLEIRKIEFHPNSAD